MKSCCEDEAELSDSAEPQFPVCSSYGRNREVRGAHLPKTAEGGAASVVIVPAIKSKSGPASHMIYNAMVVIWSP